MNFNINLPPLTSNDLATFRITTQEAIDRVGLEKKRLKFHCTGLVISWFAIVFAVLTYFDNVDTGMFVLICILAVGATCLVFFIAYYYLKSFIAYVNDIGNYLLNALDEFEQIDHKQSIEFIGWCEIDETLKHYNDQLVSLNRKPVIGEYNAARQRLDLVN